MFQGYKVSFVVTDTSSLETYTEYRCVWDGDLKSLLQILYILNILRQFTKERTNQPE